MAPPSGLATALIARPAWAKYHAEEVTSTAQKVDTESLPPPKSRRLPLPMFDGVVPSGMYVTLSVQAEAVSSAPMENSIKLWIKPVIAPEHSASKFASAWGTRVCAQFAAAKDKLAATVAMDAMTCSTLMAQIFPGESYPFTSSPVVCSQVFAASLMPAAMAASCVVACRTSKVQEATLASWEGVRFLSLKSSRSAETTNFMRLARLPRHLSAAFWMARDINLLAPVTFVANALSTAAAAASVEAACSETLESQSATTSGLALVRNKSPPLRASDRPMTAPPTQGGRRALSPRATRATTLRSPAQRFKLR
mmetsp:Transcript_103071/g.298085  ORF Transcript_103071/g.298085 Transcript_103071/m.298085 type:complete len:310 (+) Transcript_103071:747-1676(+)